MANRETYTFTITKLYLQKPLHENKSTCVAVKLQDSLEHGSETSDRSRFKLITMVGRGGSRSRSFANILSLPFSVYQMFQKAKLSCVSLFIFHEKSKYKQHYVTQCNLILELLHLLIKLLKTPLHPTPDVSLAQQARSGLGAGRPGV